MRYLIFVCVFFVSCNVKEQAGSDSVVADTMEVVSSIADKTGTSEPVWNYYRTVGPFYGEFIKIKDSTYIEMNDEDRGALKKGSSITEYIFKKEVNEIDIIVDSELSETEYYGGDKKLDSVISYSLKCKYLYYDTPFREAHQKYTLRNDTIVNTYHFEFNLEERTSTNYYDKEIRYVRYFDEDGKLIKEQSKSEGWEQTFEYDDYGNLTKENKRKVITHEYEYDNHNNWTKHMLYHTLTTGVPIQMITERTITYPDNVESD